MNIRSLLQWRPWKRRNKRKFNSERWLRFHMQDLNRPKVVRLFRRVTKGGE